MKFLTSAELYEIFKNSRIVSDFNNFGDIMRT